MIKDVLRTMWGHLYLLPHMKDLPTDEQLKDLGIESTRYSSPPPWVFNQRGVDSAVASGPSAKWLAPLGVERISSGRVQSAPRPPMPNPGRTTSLDPASVA